MAEQKKKARKNGDNPGRSREKKGGLIRYIAIAVFLLAVVGLYLFQLTRLQLLKTDSTIVLEDGVRIAVTKRTVKVKAVRGIIRDRDGVPLVRNEVTYNLVLDADTFPHSDSDANEVIAQLFSIYEGKEEQLTTPSLPITPSMADGRWYFFVHTDRVSSSSRNRYEKYLAAMDLPVDSDADTVLDAMFRRYHLYEEDEEGNPVSLLYDKYTSYRIAAVRYDLEVLAFDSVNPYCLAKDADISLIAVIRDRVGRGTDFVSESKRVFCYPGYASHILGRTGKIPAEKADYYAGLGYPMDAIVGIDGIEAAFEEVLCGTDGEMLVEEDENGRIVRQTVLREAIPGKDVWLTIRIGLQMTAEDALADNIAYIVENAISQGQELSGEDANAGALIAMDPKNGEILACASNPTYDLTSFSEHYSELASDPLLPLFNRPLMGTYAPGSTFKVGVAASALEEGIITPETIIDTKGIYTYYDDYQPRCWIYTQSDSKLNHGKINVTDALRNSCNYFFFEVGRILGIKKMSAFMSSCGLGQKTGVELPESAGILSSPAYTDSRHLPWTGADTLQAAIGQGYTAVTPVQLAVYLSSIVNGGNRYQAHFLLGITDSGGEAPPASQPQAVGTVKMSEETYETLVNAMVEVAQTGSAQRIFSGYSIQVGAKTGTAEGEETSSANGIFTAFAPADDPTILCVSVIENGASGTSSGICVRDVFNEWFYSIGK
ncbi:MAG: hypothetical protein J5938_02560 [Clostridia bacterium]|nr:hypothetical protein [Clostridia bacterium]